MDSSTLTLWTGPLPIETVSGLFLLLLYFIEFPVLNAKSVGPNQTPRFAASDLSLHCLLMPLLADASYKWVKNQVLV